MGNMKIGVAGCAGRMGLALLKQIKATSDCVIAGGVEAPAHNSIGLDVGYLSGLGNIDIKITDNPAELFDISDAVIDFSSPQSTVENAIHAKKTGKILVVGTTGLENEHQAMLRSASENAPIVYSANMSVGVNLMIELVERLAKKLPENEFDIEVLEMHHRHKVDAPSGTGLALGRAAAAGRGINLESFSDRGRDGITGPRRMGKIGFASLRGGGVPGDHTVIFASDNERLELVHKAQDRSLFAAGALRAAFWARDREPGFYSMQDVLNTDN